MPTKDKAVMSAEVLGLVVTVENCLSILALLAALSVMADQYGIQGKAMHFHTHMILVLFIIDLGEAFFSIGRKIPAFTRSYLGCQITARSKILISIARMLWIAFIAFQLKSWVVHNVDILVLKRRVYPAVLLVFIISALNQVIWHLIVPTPMVKGEMYCFFPKNPGWLRVAAVHSWSYFGMAYNFYVFACLFWSSRRINSSSKHSMGQMHQAARLRVGRKLILYIIGFYLTFFFGAVNRTIQALTGKIYPLLFTLQQLTIYIGGLWDSIAFSSAFSICFSCLITKHGHRRSSQRKDGSLVSIEMPAMRDVLIEGPGEDHSNDNSPSIFVTTYNTGGCNADGLDLEVMLPFWLPLGHDIYIIAVQELKGIKRFRSLVQTYLGGPSKYTMFGEKIGVIKGSHLADQLGWIALTIFARTSDVASGAFEVIGLSEQMAQGLHLGFTRAGNKGGIGLPFRFHHLSFLAVGAHLPADSSSSRAMQRTQALKQLLGGGSCPWDLHLQYHHTILLGDLNYRLVGDTNEVIGEVAQAAKACVRQCNFWKGCGSSDETKSEVGSVRSDRNDYLGEGNWLWERYRGLERGSWSKPTPTDWQTLLERDELLSLQAKGEILHGFREPSIAFPPSYRRVRGPGGDAFDYTDQARLQQCYTTILGGKPPATSGSTPSTSVDEKMSETTDEENPSTRRPQGGKIRVPSYTDRIWVHSLPKLEEEIVVQGYELCDAMWASDHRPVSSVLRLNLFPSMRRRAVFNYHCASPGGASTANTVSTTTDSGTTGSGKSRSTTVSGDSRSVSSGEIAPMTQPQPLVYHLHLSDIDVYFDPEASLSDAPTFLPVFPSSVDRSNLWSSRVTDRSTCPSYGSSNEVAGHSYVGSLKSEKSGHEDLEPHEEEEMPSLPLMPPSLTSRHSHLSADDTSTQMAVLFPLPSETNAATSYKAVKQLDALFFPFGRSAPKVDKSQQPLLWASTKVEWKQAKEEGIRIVSPVVLPSAAGTLHALVKVMDGNGTTVAQGVIAVPRSASSGVRQPVTIDLTLNSSYRGTLKCNVEVVKVQSQSKPSDRKLSLLS